MSPFEKETEERIASQGGNQPLKQTAEEFLRESIASKYSYNFLSLGRPIIQYPQDIVALQEVIWKVQPDVIVETGIAHGGSLILSASALELNAACGGNSDAKVIGVDIEIRSHNREAIEEHPLFRRIELIEGSSIDEELVKQVESKLAGAKSVLVILDSNHTHDHVLQELKLYSPFVTKGSYLIVFDTLIEDMPADLIGDRPWGKGNSPKTAVWEFLETSNRFEIDRELEDKLLITAASDGYLKCL